MAAMDPERVWAGDGECAYVASEDMIDVDYGPYSTGVRAVTLRTPPWFGCTMWEPHEEMGPAAERVWFLIQALESLATAEKPGEHGEAACGAQIVDCWIGPDAIGSSTHYRVIRGAGKVRLQSCKEIPGWMVLPWNEHAADVLLGRIAFLAMMEEPEEET